MEDSEIFLGKMQTFNFNNYLIHIYPSAIPENAPILYTHFAQEEADKVMELCHNPHRLR